MKYIIGGVVGLIGLCGLYYFINPSISLLMPKCPFHLLTGFDCPACGIQRAFHHFLHGDWGTAIRYNYFLVISIPYFFAVAITTFCKREYIIKARDYIQHPLVVKIILYLTILWWIARNIPYIKILFRLL